MNKATTAAPVLPPGTVIDGNYTTGALVRVRLGAATYAATDSSGARVQITAYAPECFVSPVALERSLRELLRRLHNATRHTGRRYVPPAPELVEQAGQVDQLRDRLQRAIEAEQFELAAELRDRLRATGAQA